MSRRMYGRALRVWLTFGPARVPPFQRPKPQLIALRLSKRTVVLAAQGGVSR